MERLGPFRCHPTKPRPYQASPADVVSPEQPGSPELDPFRRLLVDSNLHVHRRTRKPLSTINPPDIAPSVGRHQRHT